MVSGIPSRGISTYIPAEDPKYPLKIHISTVVGKPRDGPKMQARLVLLQNDHHQSCLGGYSAQREICRARSYMFRQTVKIGDEISGSTVVIPVNAVCGEW